MSAESNCVSGGSHAWIVSQEQHTIANHACLRCLHCPARRCVNFPLREVTPEESRVLEAALAWYADRRDWRREPRLMEDLAFALDALRSSRGTG